MAAYCLWWHVCGVFARLEYLLWWKSTTDVSIYMCKNQKLAIINLFYLSVESSNCASPLLLFLSLSHHLCFSLLPSSFFLSLSLYPPRRVFIPVALFLLASVNPLLTFSALSVCIYHSIMISMTPLFLTSPLIPDLLSLFPSPYFPFLRFCFLLFGHTACSLNAST